MFYKQAQLTCDKCHEIGSSDDPLISVCLNCDGLIHKSCFHSIVRFHFALSDSYKNINIFKSLRYFTDKRKYNLIRLQEQVNSNRSSVTRIQVRQYHGSLTTGFVNTKWPNYSITSWLILTFFKPDKQGTVFCYTCKSPIKCYGHKNPLERMNSLLNYIKKGSIALTTAIFSLVTFFMFTGSVGYSLNTFLGWQDAIFGASRNDLMQMISPFFTPHFLYCLISPTVSITNLFTSVIYSTVGLGVGFTIPQILKRFIQTKFVIVFLHQLTLNHYYFRSFKNTAPTFFGTKMSVDDAKMIQDYHNQYTEEEKSLKQGIYGFLQESLICFREDFGHLYREGAWSYAMEKCGSFIVLCMGKGISSFGFYSNMFNSDAQNVAVGMVIGFAAIQIFNYIYTNINAVMLVRCYRNFERADDSYKAWTVPVIQEFCKGYT